jgi:hypothetical protein
LKHTESKIYYYSANHPHQHQHLHDQRSSGEKIGCQPLFVIEKPRQNQIQKQKAGRENWHEKETFPISNHIHAKIYIVMEDYVRICRNYCSLQRHPKRNISQNRQNNQEKYDRIGPETVPEKPPQPVSEF